MCQTATWLPIWLIGVSAMLFLKPIQLFLTSKYNKSVALQHMVPPPPPLLALKIIKRWLLAAIFSPCTLLSQQPSL